MDCRGVIGFICYVLGQTLDFWAPGWGYGYVFGVQGGSGVQVFRGIYVFELKVGEFGQGCLQLMRFM